MSRSTITIILIAVILLLMGAGAYLLFSQALPTGNNEPAEWQTYRNQALSFSLEYPGEYEVRESGEVITLAPIYPSQAQLSGLRPITIKVADMATSTFELYTDDLEANLITNLAWEEHNAEVQNINQQQALGAITKTEATQQLVALEQTIAEEVLGYKDRFSFKAEMVNGINVLFHERDFYNQASEVYEMYADWGTKVLTISSESDHAALERVYRSLKKI